MISNKTEKQNPRTAIKDISPILGPDSETKTIAVAIIFAPKIIAKIKLMMLDLIRLLVFSIFLISLEMVNLLSSNFCKTERRANINGDSGSLRKPTALYL